MRRLAPALVLALGLAPACQRAEQPAPTRPNRIASQTVLSDEVLWDLGEDVRARVIAVSHLADDERYSPVAGQWPTTLPRARTGSEELLSLRPDLVIIASFTAAETVSVLQSSGVRTHVLGDLLGFDSYRREVKTLGAEVGAPEQAAAVVRAFDERLARVSSAGETRPGIVSYTEGLVPAAGTTFHDEAVAAGFRNLAAEHGLRGHVQVSLEQIASWDPEFVVVACQGDCARAIADVAGKPGLSASRAVRDHHVVGVPSNELFATGRTMLDVVVRLRAARESP